jgi:predicted RNA-binding protein YlqC (UPF0109 family)
MNDDELDRELQARDQLWHHQVRHNRRSAIIGGEEDPELVLREHEQQWREQHLSVNDDSDLGSYFHELVAAYVNFPSNLKVEFKEARWQHSWSLMVEPDVSDYAIVAGRRGRNFNALKVLVTGIAEHHGIMIDLLLEGPPRNDTQYIRKMLPYRVNREWTPHSLKQLVSKTLRLGGMSHIQLKFQKNNVINEDNPFDDQTFYWFQGTRRRYDMLFCYHLGQLMESMGIVQGQRLNPRYRPETPQLEKTA